MNFGDLLGWWGHGLLAVKHNILRQHVVYLAIKCGLNCQNRLDFRECLRIVEAYHFLQTTFQ